MKKTISIVAGFIFLSAAAYSANSVNALSYLRMGVGTRALGMGGAFTGLSNDVSASYYNPAGLAGINKRELNFMYGVLSNDRAFNYVGFGYPMKNYVIGLTIINAGVTDIPKYLSDGTSAGDFNYANFAFLATWAKRFCANSEFGFNLKYFISTLDESSASGPGIDIGTKFYPAKFISFGFVLQDIYSFIKWNTDSKATDTVPAVIRLGAAVYLLDSDLLLTSDLSKVSGRSDLKYNAGLEYTVSSFLVSRLGINDGNFSAGFGLNNIQLLIGDLNFDYSFLMDGLTENTNRHYISLGIKF